MYGSYLLSLRMSVTTPELAVVRLNLQRKVFALSVTAARLFTKQTGLG